MIIRTLYKVDYRLFSNMKLNQLKLKSFRQFSQKPQIDSQRETNSKMGYYLSAVVVAVFGTAYASVPLYKAFCKMTGFGGTTQRADETKATTVKPVDGGRVLRVDFTSTVHDTLPWTFVPTQRSVKLVPGETALAFYTVKNVSDKAITGVATYNVFPPKAGLYFNKIQCFCFEEQRLLPGEEVDMPVFFFLDPDILKDAAMDSTRIITLAYTFFKTGEEEVPAPSKQDAVVVGSSEARPVATAAAVDSAPLR